MEVAARGWRYDFDPACRAHGILGRVEVRRRAIRGTWSDAPQGDALGGARWPQFGGNHFLELQVVDQVSDPVVRGLG